MGVLRKPEMRNDLVVGDCSTSSSTIQGGALRTFRVDPIVESVEVHLQSDGMPLYAIIELLQGPDTNRQGIEVYTDNGRDRPVSYILETPGYGSVISIRNTWPSMEYPLTAHVVPHNVNPSSINREVISRPERRAAGGYSGYGDRSGGSSGYQDPRGAVVPSEPSAPVTRPARRVPGGSRPERRAAGGYSGYGDRSGGSSGY